jgi:hypothetical protein
LAKRAAWNNISQTLTKTTLSYLQAFGMSEVMKKLRAAHCQLNGEEFELADYFVEVLLGLFSTMRSAID